MSGRGANPVEWLRGLALSIERLAARGVASGAVRGAADELRAGLLDDLDAQARALLRDGLVVLERLAREAAGSADGPVETWSRTAVAGAVRGAVEELRRLNPAMQPTTNELLRCMKLWLDRAAAEAEVRAQVIHAPGAVSAVVDRIRLAVVVAIVLLPVLGVLRLGQWAAFRENSVRLGPDQVPGIFSILERLSRTVGVEIPELYACTVAGVGLSTALRTRRRRIIVLGPDLFAGLDRIKDRTDVLASVLAYELGRIELGHASWWEEVVLGYLSRIPILRTPLIAVQTASRDRFAATLCPESIRGLILVAAGGDLLAHVDAATFVRQVLRDDTPPSWAWVGKQGRREPHVAERIRALHRAGLLDMERVLASRSGDALAAQDASTHSAGDDRRSPPPSP
jgi:hypothetical protein